jgi:hypothetical protein
MAADLGFRPISQKLGFLSKLDGLGQAGEDLHRWAKRATAAAERRNGVVDSLWYLQDADDSDSGARFRISARGMPTAVQDIFQVKPETTEELEDLLSERNELAGETEGLSETLRKTG